ncbi:venom acid phosphatase Acph-1-like [Schistocerca nitens]|uniref:venom acid phosphatase Acph-1-like n=1 Tax=Schistocerca nitens TaxID=7011 RepID=UPI002118EE20|nr:venom acid phosphatase Acph-1-like [Schistocerca nitens]
MAARRLPLPLLLLAACATAELRLVSVVFRHGPRTPADTYPNDPYVNYDFAPAGWGQLTNAGKLSQYEQGKWLHQRYGEFLGNTYSPQILAAQSTDVDRTIMSAQLELAGLLPPNDEQRWNPELNWQPIPVHSQPLALDDLLLVRIPCPKYHQELEAVMKSEEVQERLSALNAQELYVNLTQITGLSIQNPDDVQSLYSTLKAEEEFSLQLPEWTKEYYPHKMAPITAYSFTLNGYNRVLQKLKGGPLLRKIVNDMKGKANGTLTPSQRKFYMYAGHDSTISNLLLALKVWDEQIPAYGALIMIELHQAKTSGEHSVQIHLRNSTSLDPYALKISGCELDCKLDTFLTLVDDVIPNNLKTECEVEDPNYVPPTPAPP